LNEKSLPQRRKGAKAQTFFGFSKSSTLTQRRKAAKDFQFSIFDFQFSIFDFLCVSAPLRLCVKKIQRAP
jgi:hypothetical protein